MAQAFEWLQINSIIEHQKKKTQKEIIKDMCDPEFIKKMKIKEIT